MYNTGMKCSFEGSVTIETVDLSPEEEQVWRARFGREKTAFDREFRRQKLLDRFLVVFVLCVMAVLVVIALIPLVF